jgi:hypothetical protein
MIRIFIQHQKISEAEWQSCYSAIDKMIKSFPLPLQRIEAYNGWSKEINKVHADLIKDKGTEDECICFWGDAIGFTFGNQIYFYKHWQKMVEHLKHNKNYVEPMPVYWGPHQPFLNKGESAECNGSGFLSGYIESVGPYSFLIMAIGIYFENRWPSAAMIAIEDTATEDIQEVVHWMNTVLDDNFSLPLYENADLLLQALVPFYKNKSEVVHRLLFFYQRQYKYVLETCLPFIDFEDLLKAFAEMLRNSRFGTVGFSDILNAWIAVIADLDKTLELVATCDNFHKINADYSNYSFEQSTQYDYTYLLKSLLSDYILWTPEMRESLMHFNTNKNALDTGNRDLWESIHLLTGNTINICPIYATSTELFEAFMYHKPADALAYKDIIEAYETKHKLQYIELLEAINKRIASIENNESLQAEANEVQEDANQLDFINQYAPHNQFFIAKALKDNPGFLHKEERIEKHNNWLAKLKQEDKEGDYAYLLSLENSKICGIIKDRIKRQQWCVHPDFETWMAEETDKEVLTNLVNTVHLIPRDKASLFLIHEFMNDRKLWDMWRGK